MRSTLKTLAIAGAIALALKSCSVKKCSIVRIIFLQSSEIEIHALRAG